MSNTQSYDTHTHSYVDHTHNQMFTSQVHCLIVPSMPDSAVVCCLSPAGVSGDQGHGIVSRTQESCCFFLSFFLSLLLSFFLSLLLSFFPSLHLQVQTKTKIPAKMNNAVYKHHCYRQNTPNEKDYSASTLLWPSITLLYFQYFALS